ncbi:MAG: RNA ligase family protein [Acidobacteria bacterium]|nr:RNA ligase family protein [Acidobacteriota bacterium]
MPDDLFKFPRTPHLTGSRIQPGDEDLEQLSLDDLTDQTVVVEEKVDGANAAISFSETGQLQLQSRGHFLLGGARERHFNLFKQWATSLTPNLWEVLGHQYVLYGEWVYAKHTVFYDLLPHYFLEFDVLDTENSEFLSTDRRAALLAGLPIVSVPVLFTGKIMSIQALLNLMGHSTFISDSHLENLAYACRELGLDETRALKETDPNPLMEGLYLKIETDGRVCRRFKYVRETFLQAVDQAQGHWLDRPIIPNLLKPDVDLYSL